MNFKEIVSNDIAQEESGVWRLAGHASIAYSDGAASERYLRQVFEAASDLGTRSAELETRIRDWPSEYHLTRKRAQLLSDFSFDRGMRVLEVGCGCGAITRHLAENFDSVVSIEGTLARARLARLRTRDLDTVEIACAPFQSLNFTAKFDLIVCVGVLEYSGQFIEGDDPYDAAIAYFSDMLSERGILIVAIENQFGMKYLNGASEDHLGTPYRGLEGYHTRTRVRTFGRRELADRLGARLPHVRFYYPFPDYKLPDCVLAEELLESGAATEIISQMTSRDYARPWKPNWDEALVAFELGRNCALQFFANSFIALASRAPIADDVFDQLGVLYSKERSPGCATRTRILRSPSGLVARKEALSGAAEADAKVVLKPESSPWLSGTSLGSSLYLRAGQVENLAELFEPCKIWLSYFETEAWDQGGVTVVDGSHVDSIWQNAYVEDGRCTLIDREWVWREPIRLNVLIIRSIYDFLTRLETAPPSVIARLPRSGRAAIRSVAEILGVDLTRDDFDAFAAIEAHLSAVASGRDKVLFEKYVRWFLLDWRSRGIARRIRPRADAFVERARYFVRRFVPR